MACIGYVQDVAEVLGASPRFRCAPWVGAWAASTAFCEERDNMHVKGAWLVPHLGADGAGYAQVQGCAVGMWCMGRHLRGYGLNSGCRRGVLVYVCGGQLPYSM
jgi:hypothetical protein